MLLRRRRGDERGAVLILMCVAMTSILIMSALVLDIAQMRTIRRINKSVADMSVRAGLGVLNVGPWSGVCRAADFLRSSKGIAGFDAGSEKWFQLSEPLSELTSSPCLNPNLNLCLPSALGVPNTSTWGRLTATAGGGRFSIEIQSGYHLPDARFPEDALVPADTGDPLKGECDNLSVIIREKHKPLFGKVFGQGERTTTIRSVGRLSLIASEEYSPALLLLERHGCDVLTVNSNNSRVIAQPYLQYPGVIQIDSANDNPTVCNQNQAVLNGAVTQGGPSVVACSAKTLNPTPGCNVATGDYPSRVGIYALNFTHPAGNYVTSTYSPTLSQSSYGDTQAVPGSQAGRMPLDDLYLENVRALDTEAQSVLTGNGGLPPGCATVTNNSCTSSTTGRTWLVLNQTDCNTLDSTSLINFFNPLVPVLPARTAAQNIWFNCNLSIKTASPGVILTALDSNVVITGDVSITGSFSILDPRTLYIGGKATGNNIGLDLGNGANLNVGNPVPGVNCPAPVPLGKYTKMVVGKGSFNMASGGTAHFCQTFVYMASGYGKLPATSGTPPCTCTGSNYLGTVSIGSGATIDWSAPNLINGRRPTNAEVKLTSSPPPVSPYEDLGLWTEAGGPSTVGGGGNTHMAGVFFLGNANQFTLAGNAGANVYLSAQFISTRMKVTGGAVVNLVLNPFDAVPVVIPNMVLVR